jgi:hypothetical protein
MKTYPCELTDELINAISKLRHNASQHAGDGVLKESYMVTAWIERIVMEAAKAEVKVPDKKE